jgi:ribosomal protein S6
LTPRHVRSGNDEWSPSTGKFSKRIASRSRTGRKRLAYPIKKRTVGLYWLFNFILDPQKVDGLKKALLIKERLICLLLVKKEA